MHVTISSNLCADEAYFLYDSDVRGKDDTQNRIPLLILKVNISNIHSPTRNINSSKNHYIIARKGHWRVQSTKIDK